MAEENINKIYIYIDHFRKIGTGRRLRAFPIKIQTISSIIEFRIFTK